MTTITDVVRAAKLLGALGKRPLRVALGHHQLHDAFDPDREDQQVVHVFTISCRRYQASSTSSEQKAGPIAIISPIEPGGGGSARLARSTSSTDTDDRLPLLRNEFRVWSRASAGQVQHVLDRFDHPRPAGVADPGRHVLRWSVRGRRGIRGRRRPGISRRRSRRRPTRRSGSRRCRSSSPSRLRCRGRSGCGWPAPWDQHAGVRAARSAPFAMTARGAVAEQAGSDQICHRIVFALNGQRAQFDRQQRRHLVGEGAQVVVHAGHPGRAGHTAQAEQRDAFDVRAQPDPRRQPRLQRRHGKPGNRRRKDDVDLRRLDLRLVERCEQRLLGQVEGDVDVGVVGLGEAAQLAVSRQRQRGVAELNPTAEREPPKLRAGEVGQRADGFVLACTGLAGTSRQRRDGRICGGGRGLQSSSRTAPWMCPCPGYGPAG